MDTAVDRVIDAFGGLTALSRALGHKNCTTVQGWKDRGSVPSRRIPEVIEAARAQEIVLTPADFFEELPPDPVSAEAHL